MTFLDLLKKYWNLPLNMTANSVYGEKKNLKKEEKKEARKQQYLAVTQQAL